VFRAVNVVSGLVIVGFGLQALMSMSS